VED
jgi:hypothetical protein